MNFKKDDVVVYEGKGVYVIQKIDTLDFVESQDQYYIMRPIMDDGSVIYVKVDNDKISMRNIITRENAEAMLEELPQMEGLYEVNDRVRDKEFQQVLRSCECKKCFRMMKGIKDARKERVGSGKKLGMSDDKNLQRVEHMLLAELSVVLNISEAQAKAKLYQAL